MEVVRKVGIREINDLCQIMFGGRTGPSICELLQQLVGAEEVAGMGRWQVDSPHSDPPHADHPHDVGAYLPGSPAH